MLRDIKTTLSQNPNSTETLLCRTHHAPKMSVQCSSDANDCDRIGGRAPHNGAETRIGYARTTLVACTRTTCPKTGLALARSAAAAPRRRRDYRESGSSFPSPSSPLPLPPSAYGRNSDTRFLVGRLRESRACPRARDSRNLFVEQRRHARSTSSVCRQSLEGADSADP